VEKAEKAIQSDSPLRLDSKIHSPRESPTFNYFASNGLLATTPVERTGHPQRIGSSSGLKVIA
jgi:hypothetical protein